MDSFHSIQFFGDRQEENHYQRRHGQDEQEYDKGVTLLKANGKVPLSLESLFKPVCKYRIRSQDKEYILNQVVIICHKIGSQ